MEWRESPGPASGGSFRWNTGVQNPATAHPANPSETLGDDDAASRHSRWRWVAGNIAFVGLASALGGPGMASDRESPALGIITAICFLGPLRGVSALLERYLFRQYQHRGIILSHLVGLGLGVAVGTGPPATSTLLSGLAGGTVTYLLGTLAGLCVVAAAAFIRKLRGGGRPPAPPSLSSLPALFWFNAVFIVAVGLLIAPSMAAQQGSGMTYGFTGGLIVGVLLRLPGVWAEWWLTHRAWHRTVYSVHLGSGLLTALIVVSTVVSPTPGQSPGPADTVGTAIGVYLFLCSLALLVTVGVAATARCLRRHRGMTATAPGPDFPAALVPETPARTDQAPQGPPATASRTATAGPPEPGVRTEKLRNEVAVALGIVVGLASLVQGYDSADPFRTIVAALAIGFIGCGIIYGTTIRR